MEKKTETRTLVREFISDYLSDKRHNPMNDLMIPALETAFKNLPKNYWFGVSRPAGPFGLNRVDIFTHTSIITSQNPNRQNITIGSFYMWWANSKLQIVPEAALVNKDITNPVIDFDHMDELIDLAKNTIEELAEILTARIVVGKLEGK